MDCPTITIGWASKHSWRRSRSGKALISNDIRSTTLINNHVWRIDVGIEPFPPPPPDPLPIFQLSSARRPALPPADHIDMIEVLARVKLALSGNTIIVQPFAAPGESHILHLAYVLAPRFHKDGDEPYAFESRDALRKMLVGKVVQYSVLYTAPDTGREYGILYLQDGRALPEEMLEQGWLKLRGDVGKKEIKEESIQHLEKLRKLEAKARNAGKGLFAPGGKAPIVQHDLGQREEFLNQHKGKEVTGIIEKVVSGDRMLIRLLESDGFQIQLMFSVAGIRCPSPERARSVGTEKMPAEPFGKEAQAFVEERLLQRNVKVEVVALTEYGQPIAHIVHPKGSIALFLLEAGLASCNDIHAVDTGPRMKNYREAEKKAREQRLGQFKDYVPKANTQGEKNEATVVRIQTGDTIFVQDKAGVEKRIGLSSVRAPRTIDPTESAFKEDAKEYVRKRLIGKRVQIVVDGKVPATGDYEAKEAATVTINKMNIALQLVQEGLATVIRHRKDDTDRSPIYDDLQLAEAKAKEDKKGIHSGKPPKMKPYTDASESLQAAKRHLPALERQARIPAVIDYVKAGSRFVALIPREQLKLTLVLSGIRTPKPPRNANEPGEAFGAGSLELAVKRLQQRDVEITISSLDKVGGFIGSVFIAKESFANILVEEGLATVHSSASSHPSSDLAAAEKRAKEARKNIWISYNAALEAAAATAVQNGSNNAEQKVVPRPRDYRRIMITHICPDGKLRIQLLGPGTESLEKMMGEFASHHASPTNSATLTQPPKAGEYVAAKFSEDKCWYRARVCSNDRAAMTSEVIYIDYGNSEKLAWSSLRPLAAQFSIQKLKAQARDATLSLIQLPANKDYLIEALEFTKSLVEGKELVANIDTTEKEDIMGVTVYDKDRSDGVHDNLSSELIREGWATRKKQEKLAAWEMGFEKSEEGKEVLRGLEEGERAARAGRRGIWEYGDVEVDDE